MSSAARVRTMSVAEIANDPDVCPLPLELIPNHMGINLCNVKEVTWSEQDDGQLVTLTIRFNPDPSA